MGVRACLYEITPEEYEACKADLSKADPVIMREATPARAECGLDKAWGGLRFLFIAGDYTSEAEMLDFEHAPQHGDHQFILVSPMDVMTLADNFLWEGRAAHLAEGYAPPNMRGIYPDVWERDGDEALNYLLSFIPNLREFFSAVSSRSNAALAAVG
jgi:Domain of unknown function (DUF1877)